MQKAPFPKVIVFSTLLFAISCAGGQSGADGSGELWETRELKKQASFDMNCEQRELTVVETGDNRRYGVRGCGRQATYVKGRCSRFVHECTYYLNSPILDVPGGTQNAGGPTPVVVVPGAAPGPSP